MPTDENHRVLYRELAIEQARRVNEIAHPMLREIVNHASWALARCANQGGHGPDVDLAPLALYHWAISYTDGIAELLAASCARPALPLARALFETHLSIHYLVEDDDLFEQRSLCWFCAHIHNQLRETTVFDEETQVGQEVESDWNKLPGEPWQPTRPDELEARRRALEAALERDHLQSIEAEHQRVRRERGRSRPAWYSLFDGPSNLRELAMALQALAGWELLYRPWSAVSHATDLQEITTLGANGDLGFWAIRTPFDIPYLARVVASDLAVTTWAMLQKYRPGEADSVRRWYLSDLKPGFEALEVLHDEERNRLAEDY